MNSPCSLNQRILLCQNRTCRRDGSVPLLQLFRDLAPPDLTIVASGCLGCCGSGPVVLILPDQVWYNHVHPAAVPDILQRHVSHL